MKNFSRFARGTFVVLIVLAIWEVLGRLELVGQGALPAPTQILAQLWKDRSDYPPHLSVTLKSAGTGFLIGNIIAIIAGAISARFRFAETLLRGLGMSLFAVPLIAIVPVLLLAFTGTIPRIILAAMAVYFPTYIATMNGMRNVDPRLVDVVMVAGGSSTDVLRWIRVRSALPHIVSAFRVAAPAALLGTLLAEFGGGTRWGLGTYLLGSLGQANPSRLWSIGLVATAVAASAYMLFAILGARLSRSSMSATVETSLPMGGASGPWWKRVGGGIISRNCAARTHWLALRACCGVIACSHFEFAACAWSSSVAVRSGFADNALASVNTVDRFGFWPKYFGNGRGVCFGDVFPVVCDDLSGACDNIFGGY